MSVTDEELVVGHEECGGATEGGRGLRGVQAGQDLGTGPQGPHGHAGLGVVVVQNEGIGLGNTDLQPLQVALVGGELLHQVVGLQQ